METLKYLLIKIGVKPYRTDAFEQEKKGVGKVLSTHETSDSAYDAAKARGMAEDSFTVILGASEIRASDVVSFGSCALVAAER